MCSVWNWMGRFFPQLIAEHSEKRITWYSSLSRRGEIRDLFDTATLSPSFGTNMVSANRFLISLFYFIPSTTAKIKWIRAAICGSIDFNALGRPRQAALDCFQPERSGNVVSPVRNWYSWRKNSFTKSLSVKGKMEDISNKKHEHLIL